MCANIDVAITAVGAGSDIVLNMDWTAPPLGG
jgi:hypothetical protein